MKNQTLKKTRGVFSTTNHRVPPPCRAYPSRISGQPTVPWKCSTVAHTYAPDNKIKPFARELTSCDVLQRVSTPHSGEIDLQPGGKVCSESRMYDGVRGWLPPPPPPLAGREGPIKKYATSFDWLCKRNGSSKNVSLFAYNWSLRAFAKTRRPGWLGPWISPHARWPSS